MKPRAANSTDVDHVIGVFAREGLSSALAATHRAGFGPQARVIDGARGNIGQQVQRAGLRVSWDDPPRDDAVLIVVTAPGRTATVATLFERLGAEAVVLAQRRAGQVPAAERPAVLAPDIRISAESPFAPEASD